MSAALTLSALSLPAMLLAGLAASAHCALMCGLLHGQNDAGQTMWRQAGRVCAYAMLGAVAGGAGAWLLRSAAWQIDVAWLTGEVRLARAGVPP